MSEAVSQGYLNAHLRLLIAKTKGNRWTEERTVETPLISDIVHKQDTHGAAIVRCCDCPESFLSCSIPYLQLYALAIKFNCADFEVDTDCRNERRRERVFAEP